jgi:tetratricopeptide (TPR) repeat protein
LTALRLYSQSVELGNHDQWLAALELARRAVDEDPQFASAYIWLAWALTNTGHPDYLRFADRAVQLASNASDRERYWILGSNYAMRNEVDAAVANFEALLTLQPDHYWALTSLIIYDGRLGKPSAATRYAIEAAAVRPNDVELNALVGWSLAAAGNSEQAASYVGRALDLARQQDQVPVNGALFWAYFFEPYTQWLRRDLRGSSQALDRMLQKPDLLTSEAREGALKLAVVHYLTLGNVTGARDTAKKIGDKNERALMLALTSYSANDALALHEQLTGIQSTEDAPLAVWLLGRIGRAGQAQRIAQQFDKRRQFELADVSRAMQAEIALARGHTNEAIALLTDVEKLNGGVFHRESQTLAKAWLIRGNRQQALRTLLASWERMPSNATTLPSAMFWMWTGRDLVQIYRTMNREADAIAIENRLASLSSHESMVDADVASQ